MRNKKIARYWLFSFLGTLAACYYPLYMGIKVLSDMLSKGIVNKEDYPKYIIPYTPIAVAVILGVLLMPIFIKCFKRYALFAASVLGLFSFFSLELLLENKVVVESSYETTVQLSDWQMYMCAMPAEGWGEKTVTAYRHETAVEILMGEYNPAFKLHFYVISVLLVLAVLSIIYGFGMMILSGERKKQRPLILQAVAAALFLSLCILACFTAFWRDGNLEVSPLSAFLMTLFFLSLGVVGGLYLGSFLVGKKKSFSVLLPAAVSALLTLIMYIGELILLNGNLYILGNGFLFQSIPFIVLSLFDIFTVLFSGIITAGLLVWGNGSEKAMHES